MDSPNSLKVRFLRRLLRSRLGVRLSRAVLTRTPQKPHQRISADFFTDLARSCYAVRSMPVVWSNLFVPSELFWGMGLVPFFPEAWAGLAASMGLSALAITEAGALEYPIDLCTVHRSLAGLRASDLFPPADAYVATSNACDVAGQMLGGFAHHDRLPFTFLDVPQCDDSGAVEYVTGQLRSLVDRWVSHLGVAYDRERMREAVRLSNQARTLALEVASLREAHPAPLRGSQMLDQLAMLTLMFGHPVGLSYYRALRDYTQQRIKEADPEQTNQKTRLCWMHLMPYYQTELLSHLEDDLGGVIACEEVNALWWDELDEDDPLRSLARKMLSLFYNGTIQRRADVAANLTERYRCRGVIHFSHWGCRQSAGALHVLRARLRRHGVPLLVLDGDCVDPTNMQMGPLRTRVEAFIEMLA